MVIGVRRRLAAALVLSVVTVSSASCSGSGSGTADQPAPDASSFVPGDFENIPRPAASVPFGPPSRQGNATVQSFKVEGLGAQALLDFYAQGLPAQGWQEAKAPVQVGTADWQGTWTKANVTLQVSASPDPGGGPGTQSQYDLILTAQ